MLFKVTHVDAAGHCHRARVTARNVKHALDQADEQWGEAVRLSCIRLEPKPVLVAGAGYPHKPNLRSTACAL